MRKHIALILTFGLLLSFGITIFQPPSASAAYFNKDRIIDDSIFNNTSTMTAAQINNFLNTFPNSCISPNSGFAAILPTGYNPTNGFAYGGYVSAGEVIYQAAVVYGLNPQVLIATLQKEQSLVIGGASYCENGDSHKYAAAVGYGCPDGGTRYSYTGVSLYRRNGNVVSSVSPTCVNSAAKAGFSQQVIRAAWLFKFGQQRSKGNVNWAVVHGSWDNSDDPESCYDGPMTEGVYAICPSGSGVYYSGVTNIDGQAVHMQSGATAALYWYTPHFHGNEMFTDFFTGWFGNTLMPSAFKTANNGAVYMLVNGYKIVVPSMAILQDYGISPSSIQTISQSSFDSIPAPDGPSGISPVLSPVIKSISDQDADGGAAYLVSIGKKNPIISMQQFDDFALNAANITYLPLSFVQAMAGTQNLSNFIHLPDGAIFQASSGTKRWFFDQSTYLAANPSRALSDVSGYTGANIPSGLPISGNDALIRNTIGTVFLLTSNTYYTVPSNDVYDCWGFDTKLATPMHFLSDGDGTSHYVGAYTSSGNLGCIVNDGTNNYMLNKDGKITVPGAYGVSTPASPSNLVTVASKLPTRSGGLKQYVKARNAATVWYVEAGAKRSVPSQADYSLLGLNASQVDVIEPGAVNIPPANGVKLGTGRAVKADNNGAIYVISGAGRAVFTNPDDFRAYGYDWSEVATFPANILDTQYPATGAVNVNRYLYDQISNSFYLVEPQGCYKLSAGLLTDYGQNSSTITTNQTFPSSIFYHINLANCSVGSAYVKGVGQNTIYFISGGQKRPFSSWDALVRHSNSSNPTITNVLPSTLQPLATGTTIY